jgi:hypothetical protein
VNSGATLDLVNVNIGNKSFTLNGGTLADATSSIAGPISLTANSTISTLVGDTLTLNGAVSGIGYGITKIGAGNLVNKFQGSRSGKDQFFSAKVGISYNLIKIYGEEKWKPGNKPKSASLKNKGADEKKSGFFSRRKLNRK